MFNNSLFRWRRTFCSGSLLKMGPCWPPCHHIYAILSSRTNQFKSHSGTRAGFSHTSDCGADLLLVAVKIVSDCLELDLKSRRVFPASSMGFGRSSLKLVSVSEYGGSNRVQHEVCWARLKVSHYCLNKVDSLLWEILKAQNIQYFSNIPMSTTFTKNDPKQSTFDLNKKCHHLFTV